jgi:hypothetical protein
MSPEQGAIAAARRLAARPPEAKRVVDGAPPRVLAPPVIGVRLALLGRLIRRECDLGLEHRILLIVGWAWTGAAAAQSARLSRIVPPQKLRGGRSADRRSGFRPPGLRSPAHACEAYRVSGAETLASRRSTAAFS